MSSELISRMKENLEENDWSLTVVTFGVDTYMSVETEDMAVEDTQMINEFLDKYEDAMLEIYDLHDEYENPARWAWHTGKIITEDDNFSSLNITNEQKWILSKLAETREEFSKWKLLETRHVYNTFEEESDLPELSQDEYASWFVLMCQRGEDGHSINEAIRRVGPENITQFEARIWATVVNNEISGIEEITQVAIDNTPSHWDSVERVVSGIETVYEMIDKEPPNEAQIQETVEELTS